MMCMIATGLILISAITSAFYHFGKIALNETKEDENITLIKENIPIRPPRKSRKNSKLDISQESTSIRECTYDLTISNDHGHATKLVRVQLEKIPNKTASTCEETLNSSKLLMPKSNVDRISNDDESQLRRTSGHHSSMTLLGNKHDNVKKSVIRKEQNITKEEKNETSTFYADLPRNLVFSKDRSISTSTKINNLDESNEFDDELMIFKKVFYFLNEENMNNVPQNDFSQITMIKINKNTSCYSYEDNKNANSSMQSNSYHTKNGSILNSKTNSSKRQKKLSKLFLCYSKK